MGLLAPFEPYKVAQFSGRMDLLRIVKAPQHRMTQVAGLVAMLMAVQAFASAPQASAQCAPSASCENVGADGKGILGLGIIGAEIGFMIPALIVSAGVTEFDEWWAYVLFPALFGAGGAIAGYYALEEPSSIVAGRRVTGFPEAAVAVLAVGIALIVPTFVGVLALTTYSPGESTGSGATGGEDAADDGEPAPEPEESASASALRRTLAGGPGLLRFDQGRLLLGIPMISATDTYTAEERAHMQLDSSADVQIPIVSGVF